MISPILPGGVSVLGFHFDANVEYEQTSGTVALSLRVQGEEPAVNSGEGPILAITLGGQFVKHSERITESQKRVETYRSLLQVDINAADSDFERSPFRLSAIMFCDLMLIDGPEDAEKHEIAVNAVRLNGFSMLYGMVRDRFAQITAESSVPNLVLPLVVFEEVLPRMDTGSIIVDPME